MQPLDNFELTIQRATGQTSTGQISHQASEYPVSVYDSPSGTASGLLQLDIDDIDFKAELERVQGTELDLEVRKEFGKRLFNALFNDKHILAVWNNSKTGHGLRIRLTINAPELSILPWELMYDPDLEFLATATNLVLSRYLPRQIDPPQQHIEDKVRILLVAASPQDLSQIPREELDRLEAAITGIGSSVELNVLENRSTSEIHSTLQKHNYQVVHFLGHGKGDSVALTDSDGKSVLMQAEEFAQLFQGRRSIRLIVLSACESSQSDPKGLFSGVGPALIRKGIPAVIAMQYPAVTIDATAQFSAKFYESLANELPIDVAVNQARNYLSVGERLSGRDWSTPVFYTGTRRGEALTWLANKKSFQSSTSLPVNKAAYEMVATDHSTTFQEIERRVKCLKEWLELDEKFHNLKVTFASFNEQVKLVQQSDIAMQPAQIGFVRQSWDACYKIITELNNMPSQFSFIMSTAEKLSGNRNFVDWIAELSELADRIQEKMFEGNLVELNSITAQFLRKLELRSRGPFSIVKIELQELNDLTIRAGK
jgi:hypothetical protein